MSYQQQLQEEKDYLAKTLAFIIAELGREEEKIAARKRNLVNARREMSENTSSNSNDFEKLTEMNQYLYEVNTQSINYASTRKKIDTYRRMGEIPYFGRFDFVEEDFDNREKIYIGLGNLMDDKSNFIYVYDWRSPVASIFYRYEPGQASYEAPMGLISGEVLLKRQYKIQNSELKYFFDCSIRISDEILQEVLSHNASEKMRSIVETIQREQDIIIRDTENQLLMVQGVAGSGKTSIALHRVAFLLYEGMHTKLTSENIMIISPNWTFNRYISGILPELGEENVGQTTFDNIVLQAIGDRFKPETRNEMLEDLITCPNLKEGELRRRSIEFKGSRTFRKILDRLLDYYQKRLIPFADVYYDGKTLFTREQLKNSILHDKTGLPLVKRLKRMENIILDKVHPLQRQRMTKIEPIVKRSEGHDLEIKSFSRLLAMKEMKNFRERLHNFTEVDYFAIYKRIFEQKELFFKLAQGLELPEDIEHIILNTGKNLAGDILPYEDSMALLYLKIQLAGHSLFSGVRQVVIDEAQDYYPLQYEVFRLLFKDAGFTVLGDINQSVEKNADQTMYDVVADIFHKDKAVKLTLNKSYRSTLEINSFNQKLLGMEQQLVPFERHEVEPEVVGLDNYDLVDQAVAGDIAKFLGQGYGSVAVICKTWREAQKIHARLKKNTSIQLVNSNDGEVGQGALVIPAYMAKGLEFDVVLVYGVSADNYATDFDRQLLYIACTRALHRLVLLYRGDISPFIKEL